MPAETRKRSRRAGTGPRRETPPEVRADSADAPVPEAVEPPAARPLPRVALVGRPNVGKSTLFNRMARARRALVDAVPGITRDPVEAPVEWRGRHVCLVDTGGMDLDDDGLIPKNIVQRAQAAIADADLVVLVVDAREGLVPLEREIAALLRCARARVIVAANKADRPSDPAGASEFHALGLGPVRPLSAEQGFGVDDLLDDILAAVPWAPDRLVEEETTRVAIVGRPNVGKSSLVNRMLGAERLIVSPIPGTTRDAIDVRVESEGRTYVLVDTAGLRRKGTDRARLDHVARVMAERAVARADVAVLLVDAVEGPTHQDAVIAGLAVEAGAGLVIAVNKWDLVEDKERRYKELVASLRERMKFASWAPVLTLSARTGERLHRLFPEVARVAASRRRRIATAELNAVVEAAMEKHQPPQSAGGRPFRVKYLTQAGVAPPTFIAFCTSRAPHFTWRRYLENRLREAFDFEGTPLVVRYRPGSARRRAASGSS